MERDRLEVAPVTASLANQRQRIQAIVDDWPKMTGDERKRMLALMEIRADHVEGKRLSVTFKPWPHWPTVGSSAPIAHACTRASPGSAPRPWTSR